MKRIILTALLLVCIADCWAQASFKAGWDTYRTWLVVREYTYTFTSNDSFRLYMSDSATILVATDSAAIVTMRYPFREKTYTKTIDYLNAKKQVAKTEEYKGENLVLSREWRYDDKNRKSYYFEDNKVNGRNYKKNYDYSTDKKSGDIVVTESSYFNGKIEFYTKSFYDKKQVKYKEIRLNDNNKDVIHIETYTYGADGKVKERSVFFPEFKVTKKFTENSVSDMPKCSKVMPLTATERIYLPGKAIYLRNFLNKIQFILSDPECAQFSYRYSNFVNDIIVCTNGPNSRQVILRAKERQ